MCLLHFNVTVVLNKKKQREYKKTYISFMYIVIILYDIDDAVYWSAILDMNLITIYLFSELHHDARR